MLTEVIFAKYMIKTANLIEKKWTRSQSDDTPYNYEEEAWDAMTDACMVICQKILMEITVLWGNNVLVS